MIMQLRAHNSGLFCILLSISFLSTAGMGFILPGVFWTHMVLAIAWMTQLGLRLPTSFQSSNGESQCQTEFEDLIPDLSDKEIQVLEMAHDATYHCADSLITDDTFHLPTIPAPDELDAQVDVASDQLNFVPSHYDSEDVVDEFSLDSLRSVEPILVAVNSTRSNWNQLLLEQDVTDSTVEDFEVISDSDLED